VIEYRYDLIRSDIFGLFEAVFDDTGYRGEECH